MNEPKIKTYVDFILPPAVVTKRDVSHLVTEAEWIDNELTTAQVREKTGSNTPVEAAMTREFSDFLEQNSLAFDNSHERTELIKQMRSLKEKVPVIHMTFAVKADAESLQKLVAWVRESVHPQAVIEVGLQPALVVGVYLRTPNKVHDLSVRALLEGRHDPLVKELEALRGN